MSACDNCQYKKSLNNLQHKSGVINLNNALIFYIDKQGIAKK